MTDQLKRITLSFVGLIGVAAFQDICSEEGRWDEALQEFTPVIEVGGEKIMADPCFYYAVFGSEWLKGSAEATWERALERYGYTDHASRERLVDQTHESCRYWAERGSARHQYGLGMMYLNGDQVVKDFRKAYFWLTLAENSGHRLAGDLAIDAVMWLTFEERAKVLNAVQAFRPIQ